MKKNQIFACALFMGIALGACTEDYTDWANPQSNSPEDPASIVKKKWFANYTNEI